MEKKEAAHGYGRCTIPFAGIRGFKPIFAALEQRCIRWVDA